MARFTYNNQYLDSSGEPLAGGKLYFYESGTTTPFTTYSDVAQTVANTNPVVLDAGGYMGDVFFSGSCKLVIKDSDDVQIDVVDPIGGDTLSAAEVKTLYESNSDTNEFSDSEQTKLAGIETSADVTDATNVIAALDGATIPNATIVAADKVLFQDTSDSDALKQDDAQTLADLAVNAAFDYTTLADGEYTGTTIEMIAGESITSNAVVTRKASSTSTSRYIAATDKTGSTDNFPIGMSLNTSTASTDDTVDVLLHGFVRNDAWNWTVGDVIYSANNGAVTTTAPTSGEKIIVIGQAVHADIIYVSPRGGYVSV